jgi:hypothetical protein
MAEVIARRHDIMGKSLRLKMITFTYLRMRSFAIWEAQEMMEYGVSESDHRSTFLA